MAETVAGALDHGIGLEMVAHGHPHIIDHRILHGHFHVLPRARFTALQQGGENADGAVDTRAGIPNSRTGFERRRTGQAGNAHGPAG